MGLFSKKTYICEDCGCEFESRIDRAAKICDNCKPNFKLLKKDISGYLDFLFDTDSEVEYSRTDMVGIKKHRDSVIEKYKPIAPLTPEFLTNAAHNYKNMSEEEIKDVMNRVSTGAWLTLGDGAGLISKLIFPFRYDGVFIDTDDVFAVAFRSDGRIANDGYLLLSCAFFTNDPSMPVFNIVLGGIKYGLIHKDMSDLETIAHGVTVMCPNLTYPFLSMGDLEKQIDSEGGVRGKISIEDMKRYFKQSSNNSGVFDYKTYEIYSQPEKRSAELLKSMGYMELDMVKRYLKTDKLFGKTFWGEKLVEIFGE